MKSRKLDSYVRNLIRAWVLAATLLLVAVPPAYSQMFSFGAKVGVPLTTAYTPTGASLDFSTNEQRYIIGPTVEVRLPFHLSFEVDALWRRSSYNVTIPLALNFGGNYAASVGDWQIPFMAKYERGSGPVRPFIDGGVVYRHVSVSFLFGGPANPSTAGVTVGGGVTLKLPHLRLSPEIRYARWPTPAFTSPFSYVLSTSNQADLLVGVTF